MSASLHATGWSEFPAIIVFNSAQATLQGTVPGRNGLAENSAAGLQAQRAGQQKSGPGRNHGQAMTITRKTPAGLLALTGFVMLAFASNSLLCRLALTRTGIDAASFTTLRLAAGALSLWLMTRVKPSANPGRGNWWSALALFAYAAGFSFAYLRLTTATGALLLFGAVQVTMVGHGLWLGERLRLLQWVGLGLALGGLVWLLLPGLAAPPLAGALLMLGAGIAWGVYSLRGRAPDGPGGTTAGNFLRAVPLAVLLNLWLAQDLALNWPGIGYALVSGGLASGLVYVLWYRVLPELPATSAATVQLSVPVLAALGGIVWLGEPLSLRFILATVATLGGVYLVIRGGRCHAGPASRASSARA
jgi:drug/metabolite transporter (DMT)-like permease